jgi:hypothetical protein
MKTKNLDEGDASKSHFAGAARHRNHPFSKTTPFADISEGVASVRGGFDFGRATVLRRPNPRRSGSSALPVQS